MPSGCAIGGWPARAGLDIKRSYRSESEMTETAPLALALLALPETTPGAIYGLHEVFGAVGSTWSQLTGEPDLPVRRFKPSIVSLTGTPFTSPSGVPIAVERSIRGTAFDIVVVTDLALDLWSDPRGRWPDEVQWLREQFAGGALICSVCTGSLFLAESGLLDDQDATTHWAAAPIFRDYYPAVRLEHARILCPAGPEHRIVTSGGASSWTDLALYLIARFGDEGEARRIARAFVIGDRSDGQMPFAAMARPRQHEDAVIAEAQIWIADHYPTPSSRGAHGGARRFAAADVRPAIPQGDGLSSSGVRSCAEDRGIQADPGDDRSAARCCGDGRRLPGPRVLQPAFQTNGGHQPRAVPPALPQRVHSRTPWRTGCKARKGLRSHRRGCRAAAECFSKP